MITWIILLGIVIIIIKLYFISKKLDNIEDRSFDNYIILLSIEYVLIKLPLQKEEDKRLKLIEQSEINEDNKIKRKLRKVLYSKK